MLLCLLAAAAAGAPPVAAHQRAELAVTSPAEGAVVVETAEVVVAASGGALARTDFSMALDGLSVDTSGRLGVGSVFTTFSLAAGEQLRLDVEVPSGVVDHELRVVYARDADDPRPDVVRRFRSTAEASAEDTSAGESRRERRQGPWAAAALTAALLLWGGMTVIRARRPVGGR